MKSQLLFQDSLLPFNSVQLGRLVFNAKNPQQEFIDPLDPTPSPNETTVKFQDDFEQVLSRERNSKFRSRITALLSISYESRDGSAINLKATRSTTYQLLNSGGWFKRACALHRTRLWFEEGITTTRSVYLIVGFRTITDTRITEKIRTGGTTQGAIHVSGASLAGAGSAPFANFLDSTVNTVQDVNYSRVSSFSAPGEQIYAIQYRKVEFKWLSSRNIDKASLERDNRWMICWASNEIRGNDDPPGGGADTYDEEYDEEDSEDEDEEEEGEEEEQDMLEANLASDDDLESDEMCLSEDWE